MAAWWDLHLWLACCALGVLVVQAEPPVELFTYAHRREDGRTLLVDNEAAARRAGMPALISIHERALHSLGRSVRIGEAHTRGLLHRGVWLFVLDGLGRILLLKRTATVVTCPSAWGLVGEHCAVAEPWEATGRRALTEELGLSDTIADRIQVRQLGAPLIIRTDYAVEGGAARDRVLGRKADLQVTAILAATLPRGAEHGLRFDTDVADTRWVQSEDILRLVRRHDHPESRSHDRASARTGNSSMVASSALDGALCNRLLAQLMAVALQRLRREER